MKVISLEAAMSMCPFLNPSTLALLLSIYCGSWNHLSVGISCEDKYRIPSSHVTPLLHQFHDLDCSYEPQLEDKECWGYETQKCPHLRNPIYSNCENPKDFFKQADFGYVDGFRKSIKRICSSGHSRLECSDKLTFCRGKNIFIDFKTIPQKRNQVLRYDINVLKPGEIGGQCKLDSSLLKSQLQLMSSLQSWAPELRNFVSVKELECDEIIETPTMIIKLDATVNIYHHFCDFFNIYASLHVNASDRNPNMYSDDVRVLIWENQPYLSSLGPVWQAFTKYPLWNLNTFGGKKVCFKNAIFPLLPRMVYGLFYNTPITDGCRGSSLFKAFSEFIPKRLNLPWAAEPDGEKIRVTILSRRTKHRRILNVDALMKILSLKGMYKVNLAEFSPKTDYIYQLDIIMNTDILVGIHGAGLSHMLFLPEWAVVLELSDCDDPSCYFDLTRLRGLKHIGPLKSTEKEDQGHHPTMKGSHAKFTNYSFDPDEFLSFVEEGTIYIKNHTAFRKLNKSYNEDIVTITRNEL
ncbi:LOW QUALITY PROTEIN: EGF domain-specific O-linked N-acetylglucosamine transferase [Lepeophtheirus salmonis]|uniref:LOW QUALITY PROTEIN: EGF domain-specific O-linked N-acetylglucosamine transferase n=1 Tax=Lepeophtheirus salmonis TaxID=72036 RepID=UPI001AE719F9|nr:LOW QUALITY PROTEIN: EGF domain-specific O-linked N-acetylglucosamine transferase-like [Lepeophtheirus salmonis]